MISQLKQKSTPRLHLQTLARPIPFPILSITDKLRFFVKLIDLVALTSLRKRLSLVYIHENPIELELTCRVDQTFKKAELVSLTFTYLQMQHSLNQIVHLNSNLSTSTDFDH